MSDRLDRLARRAESEGFFLASALAEFARSQRLDEPQLAQALKCSIETLTSLRLCRRPRPEPRLFKQDIDRIAVRYGVDAVVLAQAVRRADTLESLRRGARSQSGYLAAARDREKPERPAESDGEGQTH